MEIFRQRLIEAMKKNGKKSVDIARATHLSEAVISMYISGKCVPRKKNMEKLADALNVTEIWLSGKDLFITDENTRKVRKTEVPILFTTKDI